MHTPQPEQSHCSERDEIGGDCTSSGVSTVPDEKGLYPWTNAYWAALQQGCAAWSKAGRRLLSMKMCRLPVLKALDACLSAYAHTAQPCQMRCLTADSAGLESLQTWASM